MTTTQSTRRRCIEQQDRDMRARARRIDMTWSSGRTLLEWSRQSRVDSTKSLVVGRAVSDESISPDGRAIAALVAALTARLSAPRRQNQSPPGANRPFTNENASVAAPMTAQVATVRHS